jgi:hypothetical protein
MSRFWLTFCDIQTGGYEYYLFNNTFDMDVSMDQICSASGDLVVERNNAFLRVTTLYGSTATVTRRANNAASTVSSDRSVWFNPGAFAAGAPGVHGGLANYKPRTGGPLDGTGSCDPDGDGILGTDWNGDGAQETQWIDLAGNAVSCSGGGATLAEGAIQRGSGGAVCGNGLREAGEVCDGTDLGGSTCLSLGFIGGTLRCLVSCAWDTSSCTQNTAPANVNGLKRTDRH